MTRKEILAAFVAELRFQNSALRIGDAHGLTDTDEMYIGILASALKGEDETTQVHIHYQQDEEMIGI